MDKNPTHTEGILIHSGRLYDLFFGPLVRLGDGTILDLAQVSEGDSLLDIGTGPGYLAFSGARRVGAEGLAVGIDPSPEMIEAAKRRAQAKGSTARYQIAAAESLPFDDGTFDAVVSRLVFHHLVGDLKERALQEIRRVLKPGGRIAIADMSSHAGLEQAVRDAGFTQVASTKTARGLLVAVTAVKAVKAPGTPV